MVSVILNDLMGLDLEERCSIFLRYSSEAVMGVSHSNRVLYSSAKLGVQFWHETVSLI